MFTDKIIKIKCENVFFSKNFHSKIKKSIIKNLSDFLGRMSIVWNQLEKEYNKNYVIFLCIPILVLFIFVFLKN